MRPATDLTERCVSLRVYCLTTKELITKLIEKMAEGKEKSLQEKYQDSQEFISCLKLKVDHYKKAYEREKLKKEALLMKNGNRRDFDPSADSEIPAMMNERSQVPSLQTQV